MSDRQKRGGSNSRGKGGKPQRSNYDDNQEKRPRKEAILDLSKYMDKKIQVKFTGGREVTGFLKGHDPLLNLVLDETVEILKEFDNPLRQSSETRELGLLVCRGPSVILISPLDGSEEIENPFLQQE